MPSPALGLALELELELALALGLEGRAQGLVLGEGLQEQEREQEQGPEPGLAQGYVLAPAREGPQRARGRGRASPLELGHRPLHRSPLPLDQHPWLALKPEPLRRLDW